MKQQSLITATLLIATFFFIVATAHTILQEAVIIIPFTFLILVLLIIGGASQKITHYTKILELVGVEYNFAILGETPFTYPSAHGNNGKELIDIDVIKGKNIITMVTPHLTTSLTIKPGSGKKKDLLSTTHTISKEKKLSFTTQQLISRTRGDWNVTTNSITYTHPGIILTAEELSLTLKAMHFLKKDLHTKKGATPKRRRR